MSKMSNEKESILVIIAQFIMLLSIIMVIPPVLMLVSAAVADNPFWGGLPFMYLWYYIWFTIMIVTVIITATKSKSWDGTRIEQKLASIMDQGDEKEGK